MLCQFNYLLKCSIKYNKLTSTVSPCVNNKQINNERLYFLITVTQICQVIIHITLFLSGISLKTLFVVGLLFLLNFSLQFYILQYKTNAIVGLKYVILFVVLQAIINICLQLSCYWILFYIKQCRVTTMSDETNSLLNDLFIISKYSTDRDFFLPTIIHTVCIFLLLLFSMLFIFITVINFKFVHKLYSYGLNKEFL